MKEFEPSPDFVARVMTAVHAEARPCAVSVGVSVFVKSVPLRWSLALGGAVMTLFNLFRLLAPIFAPTLCG
jgi:hypothetical protein